MRKIIYVLILLIVAIAYFGNSHQSEQHADYCSVVSEMKANDSLTAPTLSDDEINEIIRMVDSMKLYGFKEGVRRFHKDSVHVTDEDSEIVTSVLHDVLDDQYYKSKNVSNER